jgi:endoplasmic reticulum chaperone BiP
MDDQDMKRDLKHQPFKVPKEHCKPAITAAHKREGRDFLGILCLVAKTDTRLQSPNEISAMALTKMKETAEAYLGEKVTHVVVTVPACECTLLLPSC